jgi:hypothetical protein
MKKLFAVLCAAMLLCSCTDDKAQKAAEGFLSSYLTLDYENAVTFCDDAVAATVRAASENWQALDTTLLKSIKEAAAETRYEITSVDMESEKGKAFVKYLLYPMGSEQGSEMNMTLTKDGGKWLVSGLE